MVEWGLQQSYYPTSASYGLMRWHCKQKCGHTVVISVIWGDLTCSGQGFVHRMTTSSIQAMSVDSAATLWPQGKIINNIWGYLPKIDVQVDLMATLWPLYSNEVVLYAADLNFHLCRFWASTLSCALFWPLPSPPFLHVHRSSQLQHHNLQCTT